MMELFNKVTDFKFLHNQNIKPNEQDLVFLLDKNELYLNDNNVVTFADILATGHNLVDYSKIYYFGQIKDYSCFLSIDNSIFDLSKFTKISLRNSFNSIAESEFQAAILANHLTIWLMNHQYCGKCGGENSILSHEFAMKCNDCSLTTYTTISPCVIGLIYSGSKILLAKGKNSPTGAYSCLAGFVNPGENLETALKREVMEEVSLRIHNIKYITSQHWPFPNSLMMGFTAEYLSGDINVDYNELADAKWYDISELGNVKLPTEISIARFMIEMYRNNYTL